MIFNQENLLMTGLKKIRKGDSPLTKKKKKSVKEPLKQLEQGFVQTGLN
jgi:hypothetical protein